MLRFIIKKICLFFLRLLFNSIYETRGTSSPITFMGIFLQKIIGINRRAYWPVHFTSKISGIKNIRVGIGSAPGLSPGCYIQGIGKVVIGDYVLIAPNVGIISANHDLYDHRKFKKGMVKIGSYCWIGMNTVVLPDIELGDFTIVGAGSVVTKSFKEGYCIIAGNPARLIKRLEREKCFKYHNQYEYYGYYKKDRFNKSFDFE